MVIGWFCAVLNRIYQLITMTRVKEYDCELYSIFDIKQYLEKKGYKTEVRRVIVDIVEIIYYKKSVFYIFTNN